MLEPQRKSAQEVEIDHLLAEEFSCDPSFAGRFVSAAGLNCPGFRAVTVAPEPSLGGEGFGDLLVKGDADGLRVALLIEDKITAGPSVRQAERYARHAERMRGQEWDQVWCILVAPAAYRGERKCYDASVDLESVAELLQSPDPVRLAYRRKIIRRAIEKRAASGVQISDLKLHRLKTDYVKFVSDWCDTEGLTLSLPPLRDSYYDGDSWITPIRCPILPPHVHLRHRLWVSVKEPLGQVDLVAMPADPAEQARFRDDAPAGAVSAPYAKGKGVQTSLRLPEMRQGSGFDPEIASDACRAMVALIQWYRARVHEPS
jgi:hypothetical protein